MRVDFLGTQGQPVVFEAGVRDRPATHTRSECLLSRTWLWTALAFCLQALQSHPQVALAFRGCGLANLRGVVEREARRALDIVVPPIPEGAVRADDDLLAASRELSGDELLFVVLLERGAELVDQVRGRDRQGLDV